MICQWNEVRHIIYHNINFHWYHCPLIFFAHVRTGLESRVKELTVSPLLPSQLEPPESDWTCIVKINVFKVKIQLRTLVPKLCKSRQCRPWWLTQLLSPLALHNVEIVCLVRKPSDVVFRLKVEQILEAAPLCITPIQRHELTQIHSWNKVLLN